MGNIICGTWMTRTCSVMLLLVAASAALPAQSFTTLHSFNGTDGANPFAGVIQASDGNLYGTTVSGGANSYGTIFKITTTGSLTTLYNLCSLAKCKDGTNPYSALLQGTDGNLYGTAQSGGAKQGGTIFEITLDGSLTTLYNFCSRKHCSDGMYPQAPLIQDANGALYGTTRNGGFSDVTTCIFGCGTVFKLYPSGELKKLHAFSGGDGALSWAGLVRGKNHTIYGNTFEGGGGPCGDGCGTAFAISLGNFSSLYLFCSKLKNGLCTDGEDPLGGMVLGNDGNLYGTTESGGEHDGGMFFEITPDGKLTRLYNFCLGWRSGMCADGQEPQGALIQASDGNFYGTTFWGGNYACSLGCGTVFKITPTGILTTLHQFDGTDGSNPESALFQGADGNFYGTTSKGGAYGDGTVFSLSADVGEQAGK